MILKIDIPKNCTFNDIKKLASFISPELIKVDHNEDELLLEFTDDISEEIALLKTKQMFTRYFSKSSSSDLLKKIDSGVNTFYSDDDISSVFIKNSMGRVALQGPSVKLFNALNKFLYSEFKVFNPEYKMYTPLLHKTTLQKVNYFRNSPQVPFFSSHVTEDISILDGISKTQEVDKNLLSGNIEYVLTPAACFNLYEEIAGTTYKTNKAFTFCHDVYRYEGHLSWDMPGRYSSFHVHEIVFFGDETYVSESLEKVTNILVKLVENIGLNAELNYATDSFVMPKMSQLELLQKHSHAKQEIQAYYSSSEKIAICSTNFHNNLFSKAFSINCESTEATVSGCFGLGMERIIYCILKSYGFDEIKWPKKLKDFVNDY